MPQQVEAYLRSLNTSDRARAAAWDAVYSVKDDTEAQRLLASLPFGDDVKATLWDARKGVEPEVAPAAETPEQQPSAASRFFSNAGAMLNPLPAIKGLVTHPIDTAKAIYGQQAEQFGKAREDASQGRYLEAAGHGAAGVLPLVGPAAAHAGEQIASGDVAGGLGTGTGLLVPFAGSAALRARVGVKAKRGAPDVLERQAAQQVSQRVLAPGNVAFKGKAEAIAPEVLRRNLKGGREELAQAADEGMATAAADIDAAIQSSGGGQSGILIDPIIGQLQRKIDSLTIKGEPIKGAEGRVAGLRARIDQIQRTSRVKPQRPGMTPAGQAPPATIRGMSFDDLRRIRDEQYRIADEARAYRRMGNPALSDEGFAAAETGSAIRQEFARLSPDLAAANADYTFFKTLGDILDSAQGRPKVTAPSQGVTGGAATTGAVAGHLVGPKAAFVLSVVRPWVQRMRSEPAWQLADAQTKMRLADAIRNGDVPTAQKLMARISEGAVAIATTPTESRNRTTAPGWLEEAPAR